MTSKPKILFVDDEPHLLQALQRSLRSMRHEWHMEFVEGGAQALARLDGSPFDVIVTDMKMPGMSGYELLDQAVVRHPAIIRFVLSGHAEQAQVMRCVGATHQFLSKPCPSENLVGSLQRVTALQSLVPSPDLRRVLARLDRLPCAPAYCEALLCVLKSPQPTPEDLAALIAQDPGATALILKLASSDFFGTPVEGLNVGAAVTEFGVDALRTLALPLGLLAPAHASHCPAFDSNQFWTDSLHYGCAMKHLVETAPRPEVSPSEAYVVGLLLEVGRLILATEFASDYATISSDDLRSPGGLPAAERARFGVSHAEVGAYLVGLWGLPTRVVETISHHHDLSPPAVEQPALLELARAVSVPSRPAPPARGSLPPATPNPNAA